MRKSLLTSLILILSVCAMAQMQTQQGYVKTKGRLAKDGSVIPGQPIANVSIIIRGGNSTVSEPDGTFYLSVPNGKYYLQNIQKQGYVLTDPEVLSKEYSHSRNTMVLVMEDLAEQQAELRAMERKISSKFYFQLQKRAEELDSLKEQNKITEEKYRELLQKLNQDQDNSQTLIEYMVERYAKIDFDQIDEFNRKVSEYIINGRLTEADSMIQSKGNILSRVYNLNLHHEANAQAREQLDKSEYIEQKERDDIAQDCYSKHEIAKMRFENDSAAYYIELRASLDSTNLEWLNDAGEFYDYLGDYEHALAIFQLALHQSLEQYGEQDEHSITIYLNSGIVHKELGDYDEALKDLEKALSASRSLFGDSHILTADSYTNLGSFYRLMENYPKAKECHEKALAIGISLFGEVNQKVSKYYNNLGIVYESMGDYEKALEYHNNSSFSCK